MCIYFNITYIIIIATCFDSYDSSSGIIKFKILMPEDDSQESKHVAKIITYVILKLSKYIVVWTKYIVDLQ